MRMLLSIPLLFAVSIAMAREVRVDDFLVKLPDSFEWVSAKPPMQLIRGDGIGITITAFSSSSMIGTAEGLRQRWSAYAHGPLLSLAQRHGKPTALQEEQLQSGSTLYSISTFKSESGQPSFGVIYFLVSPAGDAAQFAIEGLGDSQRVSEELRPFVTEASWRQAP